MLFMLCISFYSSYFMHLILFILFYASHSIHLILSISFYSSYFIYASQHIHCSHCNSFYAFHSMYPILYIAVLFSFLKIVTIVPFNPFYIIDRPWLTPKSSCQASVWWRRDHGHHLLVISRAFKRFPFKLMWGWEHVCTRQIKHPHQCEQKLR